jgi:hypothetical protein
MTYVVVGHQRTGTTYLMDYVRAQSNFNKVKFTNEFFLDRNYLSLNGDWNTLKIETPTKKQIERKFNYFEILKEENMCHPFKVIPYKIILDGYEKRLYDLLNGFKLLTIERNPFDTFLSWVYQNKTNWIHSHKHINEDLKLEKNSFDVDILNINYYLKRYEIEKKFISKLNLFHTFKYEELTEENLKIFFNIKNASKKIPMDIDYRSCIKNIDFVEKKFKEIYNDPMVCR